MGTLCAKSLQYLQWSCTETLISPSHVYIKAMMGTSAHTGSSINPLRPTEATRSAFKGDILEEAIQTASNEFLMMKVARRNGKKQREGDPC